MTAPSLWITILAGGVGSRFWPISTPRRPKQLLPLASARPLVLDTLERARAMVDEERILVLTGDRMVEPIRRVTGLGPERFLVEPRARGTGPVLFWAAWELARRDPDAVVVSLHSDHVIRPPEALADLLRAAAAVARDESLLLTVAVPPDRPETGYGYIQPGAAVAAPAGYRAYRVDAFVEKPDEETAGGYVSAGYRWNSGIFVWKAQTFVDEAAAVAPEIATGIPALEAGDVGGYFEAVETISVDEAVLERSGRVGSIDADFQWDDVGGWEALSRTREVDADGNVCQGPVHAVDASGNIAFADQGQIVLLGVEGLIVVRTGELTVVMPRREAPHLKRYLSQLPPEVRDPPTGGDEAP